MSATDRADQTIPRLTRQRRSSGLGPVLPGWADTSGSAVVRWAWVILPVGAALLAVETVAASNRVDLLVDSQLFTTAGCQILSGHIAAAYSNPALQSGPLQNAFYCAASKVTPVARSTVWFVIAAAAAILGVLAGLRVVRRRAGLAPSAAAVATGAAYIAFWALQTMLTIHLAEIAIPVMWVAAALFVRRHPLWAGLVLGASVGMELWGLVAIPLVFAARTWGHRLAGAAMAALVAAAVVLPFAAAGHMAMFHFRWPVMPHTLPALIWPATSGTLPVVFGLAPRVLQLVVALGGCAAVAHRVGADARLVPWAPAMAAEFLRLLLDPTLYTYYWVVPELLAAVALVCAVTVRERVILAIVAVLQVAGELNEYRVMVIALSLLLLAAAVYGPARVRRVPTETAIQHVRSPVAPTWCQQDVRYAVTNVDVVATGPPTELL